MTSRAAHNKGMIRLAAAVLLITGLATIATPAGIAQGLPPDRPPEPLLRQQIAEILSHSEYQIGPPLWLIRIINKAGDFLLRLLRAIFMNPVMSHLYQTMPLLYWLLVIVLLAAIVLLLYHIVVTIRSAFGRRHRQRREPTDAARLPVTSPGELRRRARRLADGGDFAAALLALHQACLRWLERHGHLRYRPWLTNGEYLGAVRTKPQLFRLLTPLTRAADRIAYGRQSLAASAYLELDALADQLWQRAGG